MLRKGRSLLTKPLFRILYFAIFGQSTRVMTVFIHQSAFLRLFLPSVVDVAEAAVLDAVFKLSSDTVPVSLRGAERMTDNVPFAVE